MLGDRPIVLADSLEVLPDVEDNGGDRAGSEGRRSDARPAFITGPTAS